MIQVNLIPDLKAEYLKSQRVKRMVISVSLLASIAFLSLLVVMFSYVNVVQKAHTDNLAEDIASLSNDYTNSGDIDKVVTVQRQLESLPGLHDSKPLISRIVTYLTVVTPNTIEYRSFDVDYEASIITAEGNATAVIEVNTFVDSLKNAVYTVGGDTTEEFAAFSDVILDNISTRDGRTRFSVTFSFEDEIFTNSEEIQLSVPQINSTLSEVESPKGSTNNNPVDDAQSNDVFETTTEGGN